MDSVYLARNVPPPSTGMRQPWDASLATPSASAAWGPPTTSVTPAGRIAFFSTQPACRTALRATMLMRTATGVPPATALVGHVKGDAAHSASPARRAGSSWEKSACRNAGKDIMQKIPLDGVSGAARAARRAGAHSTQTACHVIHSSFCCAPGESVTAPAQSITMQTKAHRHVRGATQLARNAKEKECSVAYPVCGVTT